MFQAFTSPLPSVLEVFTRYRILSTQKRTPKATVVDVNDLNFTGINRDLPSSTSHKITLQASKDHLGFKANLSKQPQSLESA